MNKNMKDSGIEWIGLIPETWVLKKNKYNFVLGKEIVGNSSSDMQLLSLTKNGIKAINEDEQSGKTPLSFDTYQVVHKNDIVMCLFDLDVSAVFSGISSYEGMISPAYKCFRCLPHLYPKYVDYYFRTVFDGRKYKRYSKNVRFSLGTEEFMSIPILVPPIEEQIKIVNTLDTYIPEVDTIISKTRESIEEYKKYKQAIITETITNGMNPNVVRKESGVDYIDSIPSHWTIKRLRFLGGCQNGISKGGESFGSGYPFVSYGDVYKNYALPCNVEGLIESTDSEREIYSVKRGDVFFTRTSETIEEVGFTSTCLKTIDDATFAGFVIRFRPFDKSTLLPEYSKYYFRSDMHRRFFVKEMNLVTRASLSQELLKKLPVILPPIDEQKQIASYLEGKCFEIDKLIEKKQAFIEEMEQYKKSLIYEYVTGKKNVE